MGKRQLGQGGSRSWARAILPRHRACGRTGYSVAEPVPRCRGRHRIRWVFGNPVKWLWDVTDGGTDRPLAENGGTPPAGSSRK